MLLGSSWYNLPLHLMIWRIITVNTDFVLYKTDRRQTMDRPSVIQLRDKEGFVYADLKQNHEQFQHFAKHSHATFSLCMIGTGKISILYHPDTHTVLHPGELAIFHPDQVHLTQNLTASALPYYNLHINKEWVLAIQQELFDTEVLLPTSTHIIQEAHYATALKKIISQINQETSSPAETEERVITLLKKLFLQYTDTRHHTEEERLFEEIKQFILEHIDQEISAASIAAHTGYSTAHISRRFKQRFGLTLQAFLIDQRIHHAKALILKESHLSLAQIALEAGFYDQSHFIKNFKKAYAISPNAYKSK